MEAAMDKNAQLKIVAIPTSDEALDTFPSEAAPETPAPAKVGSFALIAGAITCVVAAIAAGAFWLNTGMNAAVPASGSLTVESEPTGVDVLVDGSPRGKTPVTIALVEGKHQLVLQRGARSQQFPRAIKPNIGIVHHVTWPADG